MGGDNPSSVKFELIFPILLTSLYVVSKRKKKIYGAKYIPLLAISEGKNNKFNILYSRNFLPFSLKLNLSNLSH